MVDDWDHKNKVHAIKKDDGEWVKWEDVEKLMSEGRIISKESVEMLNKMYDLTFKGAKP
jgi:hypothetical protein